MPIWIIRYMRFMKIVLGAKAPDAIFERYGVEYRLLDTSL